MRVRYKAFIIPHLGDPYRLCADRFSIGEEKAAFAISDGVGNSLFPEVWAQSLCDDYVQTPGDFICDHCLCRENQLISKWEKVRDDRVSSFSDDELFIYEMGLGKADFAAATFVGLRFSNESWHCLALGDSYLVVLDGEYNVVQSVASMSGRPFDNFPEYFASKKGFNNGTPLSVSGEITRCKYFLLMSDAISDWFLSKSRTAEERKELIEINTHGDFQSHMGVLRSIGELKDDDTTIVVISVEDDGNSDISFERLEVDDINSLIETDVELPQEDPLPPFKDELSDSAESPEPVELEISGKVISTTEVENKEAESQSDEPTLPQESGEHTQDDMLSKDVSEEIEPLLVEEPKAPSSDIIDKYQAEIDKLHVQLERSNDEIKKLSEKISEKELEIVALKKDNSSLKNEIEACFQQIEEETSRRSSLFHRFLK